MTAFIQTIAQTLGPDALIRFIDASEAIKRLAAAQGIDILNLVKTEEQMAQELKEQQQAQVGQSLVDQAGQLLSSPGADPSKNPALAEQMQAEQEEQPPEE